MKILMVHNSYKQRGGEDTVFEQEKELLQNAGHTVIEYCRSNYEIDALTFSGRVTLPTRIIWATDTVHDLKALIHREKPDLAHFHNTFVMVSPSAYYACQEMGVPVVQTLHNYRLLCPRADFFRDGRVCEDCLYQTLPFHGVMHGCYHGSRLHSSGVAMILLIHRLLKTWQRQVDVYIALTEFARRKFIQGGFPRSKLVVKPNFVLSDPGVKENSGGYALYIGRFSPEKKIMTILKAMRRLSGIPLKIVGDGPEKEKLGAFIKKEGLDSVEILNFRPRQEIFVLMKKACFLIFPSEWYEGLPMIIAEAFACGVPVISSRLGSMEEIVDNGRTGLHFTAGDSEDLVSKIEWAWSHPGEMNAMGRAARKEYEKKYTAEDNLMQLLHIYQLAISKNNSSL